MFVLNPGGNSGARGVSGSDLSEKIWFFGKLGIYFAAVRLAFVYMSDRDAKVGGEAK